MPKRLVPLRLSLRKITRQQVRHLGRAVDTDGEYIADLLIDILAHYDRHGYVPYLYAEELRLWIRENLPRDAVPDDITLGP